MLCDLLMEYSREPKPPIVQIAYTAVADRVRQAPRFVLQRDATLMIHNVSESTPSRLLAALNLCRLPFPSMWVEFEFRHRAEWMRDAIDRGTMTAQDHPMTGPPQHLGFLIEREQDDDRVINVLPVWKHSFTEYVSLCNLGLRIDTRSDTPPPDAEDAMRVRALMAQESTIKRWVKDPKEVEAAVLLNNRIDEHVPDYHAPMWETILDRDKRIADQLLSAARFDLKMEWRFVIGLLVALNSRNLISYGDEQNYDRLNKSRVRSGKLPLLTHRPIQLHLTRAQHRRNALGASRSPAEAHAVRGHFKLRKSGIWWWSEHSRGGQADGPRTYDVRT